MQTIAAFVDLVTQNIKSPSDNASTKVEHTYLGPMDSKLAQALMKCDADVRIDWRDFLGLKRWN